MAQQIGFIRENQKDGFAIVVTNRKGACGGCHEGSAGCGSCLAGTKLESRVINSINAKKGDVVKISLDSSELFKGAVLLYVIPVVCLIISALAGAWIAEQAMWDETAGSVVGALVGLILGIGAVVRMGRSDYIRRHMTPSITAVITPSSSSQPISPQPTCCG